MDGWMDGWIESMDRWTDRYFFFSLFTINGHVARLNTSLELCMGHHDAGMETGGPMDLLGPWCVAWDLIVARFAMARPAKIQLHMRSHRFVNLKLGSILPVWHYNTIVCARETVCGTHCWSIWSHAIQVGIPAFQFSRKMINQQQALYERVERIAQRAGPQLRRARGCHLFETQRGLAHLMDDEVTHMIAFSWRSLHQYFEGDAICVHVYLICDHGFPPSCYCHTWCFLISPFVSICVGARWWPRPFFLDVSWYILFVLLGLCPQNCWAPM